MSDACADCGFDPAEWNEQDTVRTLARADYLLRHVEAGLPDALRAAVDAVPGGAHAATGLDAADDRASVHRLLHRCWSIAELRAAAGDLPAQQRGAVVQLNASDGGVPKLPVEEATVGRRGVQGDRQGSRRHHGRPWQALCLYSADVIAALQAEGHPIEAGSAGENITVGGLDWSSLRGGLLVDIGPVRCRLSVPAEPCVHNHRWFAGTTSQRIDHDRHPGWSRWYASVVTGGTIRPGDAVVLAPR